MCDLFNAIGGLKGQVLTGFESRNSVTDKSVSTLAPYL